MTSTPHHERREEVRQRSLFDQLYVAPGPTPAELMEKEHLEAIFTPWRNPINEPTADEFWLEELQSVPLDDSCSAGCAPDAFGPDGTRRPPILGEGLRPVDRKYQMKEDDFTTIADPSGQEALCPGCWLIVHASRLQDGLCNECRGDF
jgi:hypothetical protein